MINMGIKKTANGQEAEQFLETYSKVTCYFTTTFLPLLMMTPR